MPSDMKRRKVTETPIKSIKKDSPDEALEEVKPKFGPLPQFRTQKIWARGVMVLGVFAVVYFSSKPNKEISFARYKDVYERISQEFPCSEAYSEEMRNFPGCVPRQCGRLVSDKFISLSEATALQDIAKRGFAVAKTQGGATILDLHSGAVTYELGFINIYKLEEAKDIFKDTDFELYRTVKLKIQKAIADYFGVDVNSIYLTHPTFFSRLTNVPPKTIHDEYWHVHVDKETYEAFHFTSLLYLSDYGTDFQGGRFVFVEKNNMNITVEPKTGRVSMFSSGSENTHFVEQVSSGIRYAITVSFTCDKNHAISDPVSPGKAGV